MALDIAFNDFSFCYAGQPLPALKNIDLRIPPGSVCAVLGPTGSGKSTLLQSLAGVLGLHHQNSKASGSIRIGADTYEPLPRRVLFPTVGLALQDPYVQISGVRDTVQEEVSFTLENLEIPTVRRADQIRETLRTLGIAHLAIRRPTDLSGGEQQRVALATILAAQPAVLLLDEPATSLDYQGQRQLVRIVDTIRTSSTVVLADSAIDLSLLAAADLFAVLDSGTLVFSAGRSEFLRRLPEFVHLLPVEEWQQAVARLQSSASRRNRTVRRLVKLMGLS